MKKLWFTSDLHLMQRNIIKKLSKWESAHDLRDFEDQNEMSWHMVDQINKYVQPQDDLWILGDVYFGKDFSELEKFMKNIHTPNKHLILGNHDWIITKNYEESKKLFKSIDLRKELKLRFPLPGTDPDRDKWEGRVHINLNHYAERVWNKSHRGAWMLYGHSHSSLDDLNIGKEGIERDINAFYAKTRTMDVGMDNVFKLTGEYKPLEFWEIFTIFESRTDLFIDHHDRKTNE